MRFELILFDADNTLLDFDRAARQALEQAFATFDLNGDSTALFEIYEEINHDFWRRFERGEINAATLKRDRFRVFLERVGSGADPAAFGREYLHFLSHGAFLLPHALEILAYCRSRYRMVLLSNGLAAVQRPRFAATGLERWFDGIVISEEVGTAKPDPEIFRRALAAAGHADPATTLMVGDNLASDIKGGNDAGMHTCWLRWKTSADPDGIRPDYVIDSLLQLKDIL